MAAKRVVRPGKSMSLREEHGRDLGTEARIKLLCFCEANRIAICEVHH